MRDNMNILYESSKSAGCDDNEKQSMVNASDSIFTNYTNNVNDEIHGCNESIKVIVNDADY